MQNTEFKGNWIKTKDNLKQKFALLNDNDRFLKEDMKDRLFGRLQVKLGKSTEELQKIISSLNL